MAFRNQDAVAPFNVVDSTGRTVATIDVNGVTLTAANGSKILLDPTQIQPVLQFLSPDGTNDAFINAVSNGTPNRADLGMNSGKYTPSDGVTRRMRAYFSDSTDYGAVEVIRASDQSSLGGRLVISSGLGFLGYKDLTTDRYFSVEQSGIYATDSIGLLGGDWTDLAFVASAGWKNRGAPYSNLGIRKVAAPVNSMQIDGQILTGTVVANATPIANLPAGMAPITEKLVDACNGAARVRLAIQPSGAIWCFDCAGLPANTVIQVLPGQTIPLDR